MVDDPPESTDTEQPAKDEADRARKWVAEIHAAEKAQSKWVERAKKVEKIYADERDVRADRSRKFNVLWSNVETLRPAVYMQTPKAQAVRRYRDRDPVARCASMLLERALQTSCELYDFDHAMDQVVRDRLVPGRGQAWVFYEPGIVGTGDMADVAYHSVVADYVPWKDFLHSQARTWSEVRWVARRFRKSRSELKKWLSERGINPAKAQVIKLDFKADGKDEQEERSQAQIWEVWDKEHDEVLFIAPASGEQAILHSEPPATRFRDFFPCPRPMLATITSDSLIPTPDYALYQDQAEELNRLTERIGVLQKALRVVGVYASESKELADMLAEGSDNKMVAVENWAMFAEGGGVKGRIEWFPVEQVAAVLTHLYQVRDQAKQTLYEVSGIGDILRGNTDPDETATAQGIKAKWGSLRVRRVQKDTQRFAADIMRLKAEVMAEQFPFDALVQMAGVDRETLDKYMPPQQAPQLPPDAPPEMAQQAQMMAEQQRAQQAQAFMAEVERLLRDDTARSFRIDVETDSTLEPDEMEEKAARTEFMQAMTLFMEKAAPMAMQSPETAKLVGELLMFSVRGFKKADSLEQTIEQAMEAMQKAAAAPKPNPEAEKMKAEAEAKKGELALKGQELQARTAETQGKLSLEGEKLKLEKALAVVEAKIKAKELQIKERELGLKERDIAFRGEEIGLRREEVRDKREIERDRLEDGKVARRESFEQEKERRVAEGSPPEPKEDKGALAMGEGLKAVAEALSKSKEAQTP